MKEATKTSNKQQTSNETQDEKQKVPKWKREHENFINSIKFNKKIQNVTSFLANELLKYKTRWKRMARIQKG